MKFAYLKDDKVVSIVHADSEEQLLPLDKTYQNLINIETFDPQPDLGWSFNGSDFVDPDGNIKKSSKITKLAFQNRFTDTEFMSMLAYCDTVSNPYCYAVRMIIQKQSVANYIDLRREDTIRGVGILVTAGIITSTRAQLILNATPNDREIYKGTE